MMIVILGGGIAGLVSAHELTKAGYRCTVLEARDRVGGRNWSCRQNMKVALNGIAEQVCVFEQGQYFNAGPARLASTHTLMLGYCRELGVPLEVEVNTSRSALLQSAKLNGGKPVEQRRVVNDARGYVAELLTKSIKKGALDAELSVEDRSRMTAFLSQFGDLNEAGQFRGTGRSGYMTKPGAADVLGSRYDPLPLHALLDSALWASFIEDEEFDKQATMFQPVGGMDRIPAAFEKRLGPIVRLNAEVVQIRQGPIGVQVTYRDRKSGSTETVGGIICICALPLEVLKSIDADFSNDVKEMVATSRPASVYKVAWESRRFWEQDYDIYGGISYLSQAVDLVWYPSGQLFSQNGILVAGYGVEDDTSFGRLPNVAAKIAASRQAVETLHPGHGGELKNPLYVNWAKVPFSLGSWTDEIGGKGYNLLIQPDRRLYFAGDHASQLLGWQEGSALSAQFVLSQIGRRLQG
jgi:monoamine oxidase